MCYQSSTVWTFNEMQSESIQGGLSGLWQFLAIDSPLKAMKNAF